MAPRFTLIVAFLLICVLGLGALDTHDGWLQAQTDHFVFLYEARDTDAVQSLLVIAEGVYDQITSYYDSYPKKIYCVINGRGDLYSNNFTPLPAHINLTVASQQWPHFGPRSQDWLELVFTHELTHYIQLVHDKGFFPFLSLLFGPGAQVFNNVFLSNWMVEGQAVLSESLLTSGGRGDSPFFEMIGRAMVFDGKPPTYARLGSTTPFSPPQRPYIMGYLLSSYIYRHFGPESLRKINDRYMKFPFFGPEGAIRRVTGKKGRDLLMLMMAELEESYKQDMDIEPGRLLVPEGYGNYFLPIVTKRGWIMYRSSHNRQSAIVLYNPVSREEIIISKGYIGDPSSITADAEGRTIVFAAPSSRIVAGIEYDFSDLFILREDNADPIRLTEESDLYHPALSPDGTRLVAVRRFGSYSALVTIDALSGEQELLYSHDHASIYNPAFSEDGSHVAFVLNSRGIQDIQVIPYDVDTLPIESDTSRNPPHNQNIARYVTGPDGHGEYFPAFYGDTIIFSSDRSGKLELYAKDMAGTGPVFMVADDPVGAYAGRIVGNSVVYASQSSKGYVLRSKPLSAPLASAPPPKRVHAPPPVLSQNPVDSPAPERYRDFPKFLWWLPLPTSLPAVEGSPGRIGIGAQFNAASILGRTAAGVFAAFDPAVLQPILSINTTIGAGNGSLLIDLFQGFTKGYSGTYIQSSQESVAYQYPFIANIERTVSTFLAGSLGLSHLVELEGPDPFRYFAASQAKLARQWAFATTSVLFERARGGGRKDFFDPFSLSTRFATSALTAILSDPHPQAMINADVLVRFPSPLRHQVVGLGIKSSYGGNGLASLTPALRGSFTYDGTTQQGVYPGNLIATLEYMFHIALMDLPLPYGMNVDQIGGGFYIEKPILFDIFSPGLGADTVIYPGFDIIVSYGSVGRTRIGVGVSARIDVADPASFKSSDIAVYVFSGTKSFLSGATAGRSTGY